MFERQQKAEVVRIKNEAVSLDSAGMPPSLDGPLVADSIGAMSPPMSGRSKGTDFMLIPAGVRPQKVSTIFPVSSMRCSRETPSVQWLKA